MTLQFTSLTPQSFSQASLLGRGRTAEVYLWGELHVLKLFYDGWPEENVQREWAISQVISQAGLTAPATGELIRLGSQHGIVFERVNGKSLLNQFAAHPWSLFGAARLLAGLHAEMHSKTIPDLPSQRQQIQNLIRRAPTLAPRIRSLALERLDMLPDGETVCHGDYHPDNVMVTPHGPVIIDWNSASQGNPLADVAYTSLLLQVATPPPSGSIRQFLMNGGRTLAQEIYLSHHRRLTGTRQETINAWALPIAAARLGWGVPDETDRLQKYLISRTI
ncbi:MAG: aminoglycoside phosphotransferase family protein [Anaerolineales bacterium]